MAAASQNLFIPSIWHKSTHRATYFLAPFWIWLWYQKLLWRLNLTNAAETPQTNRHIWW